MEVSMEQEISATKEEPMILADNLVKIYKTAELEVLALQGLDLQVERGELLAIIGNSGSGKSTFLNMLGGLDTPSAGKLFVDGKNLFTMTEKQLVEYKRDTVGFVWQNNARNLLPYLSALENVMTPMQFGAEKNKKEQALKLLDMVGMSHKKASRLNQLSGGEQQRIAIAIALANQPKLLLADEPTGSVDRKTADYILDVFRHLNRDEGQTIVIVTHDVALSKQVQRVVAIRDGKFSSERILKEQYSLEGATAINWQDEETQEEYAIIDRAGRIQIPKDMLTEVGIVDNKLRMEVKDGKIVLEKV
jgi:ABC-type lipoprotein export system ATPase subunit